MKAEFIQPARDGAFQKFLIAGGDGFGSEVIASVSISDDEAILTRVDIVANTGMECFQSVRCHHSLVYIGVGQYVFVVDVKLNRVSHHLLHGYFGHFYDSGDLENLHSRVSVLATSASEVLAFSETGDVLWRQAHLGIDGVIIRSVSTGCLHGEGEWDPPGGWRPFSLIEESGEILR